MADLVSSILNALENPKIKGLEYAIRGATSITFDGLLDAVAKHCSQPDYRRNKLNVMTDFAEEFFVGRTHDKNLVKMIQWHEIERQNYLNGWDYMKKYKLKETRSLKDTYAEGKVEPEKYTTPYLYKYKHIALD